MRVLVTGADGFVGRHLVARLAEAGHTVLAGVRSGRKPAAYPEAADVQPVVVGDIGPQTDWEHALSGVQTVVHLAARAHVLSDTETDPLAAFRRVNCEGTVRLARQAARAGVGRFVYLSSIAVHGDRSPAPLRESDPPAPQSPYGMSKWEAEQGLRACLAGTGTEWTIIRPPLVYGPDAPGNFASLVRVLSRGWPLPLGRVRNRRSLVFVGNLADLICGCSEHPDAADETFVVSDGKDLSTSRLLALLSEGLGRRPRLLPVPAPLAAAVLQLVAGRTTRQKLFGDLQVDSARVRRVLGWQPPYSVEEGIARSVSPGSHAAGSRR